MLVIVCGIAAGAIVAAYPIRIGPPGVRSYDLWGRYSQISWGEIRSVEAKNYLGFHFLRVQSTDGRSVILTPWVRDLEGFLNRVSELAGPENALAQSLESYQQLNSI